MFSSVYSVTSVVLFRVEASLFSLRGLTSARQDHVIFHARTNLLSTQWTKLDKLSP